jgi:hypothetical protein
MHVKRNIQARSRNNCCCGNAISTTYWCVCVHVCACLRASGYPSAWACACAYVHTALLIQHATRMRHIVTSFVVPRSLPYFSTLSHKRYDFWEILIEHKTCFRFLCNFCNFCNISLFKKNLARYRLKCRNVFM